MQNGILLTQLFEIFIYFEEIGIITWRYRDTTN